MQQKTWNGEPLTPEERNELRTLFDELKNTPDDQLEIEWSAVVVRWRTAIQRDEYNPRLGRGEEGTNVKAPEALPSVQMAWINEGLLKIASAAVERVKSAFLDAGLDADVDCDQWTGVAVAQFKLPWTWDDPASDGPKQSITVRLRAATQPNRCRTERPAKKQREGHEHHALGGIVWTLLLPEDNSNPAQVDARRFARVGMNEIGYAISANTNETSHPQVSSTNALRSFLTALWQKHWSEAVGNSPQRMNAFFQTFSKWTPEAPGAAPVRAGPLTRAPPRAAAGASGAGQTSTDDGPGGGGGGSG